MNKSTTKKSTKIAIRTIAIVLMCLLVALTSVGIYFATRKKEPSTPEVIVDPLEFATDKWDGETVDNSEFLSGDKLGNRGDHTYTINSASSFVYFIGLVNDENRAKEYNYFKDYTIYLNSNIDLSGYSIQSIGKKVTNDQDETISTFQGTFNGAYYSIMNADIVGNGLFGYVENANIQNVGLYNATINSTSDYTGSIVGEAVNSNISNVYARLGSVQGSTVGGIVGSFISNNGTHTISNSFVDNTLIGDKVGAIAGNVDTKTTSANAVTISYVYYTQQLDAINSFAFEGTAEENYVTLNNIINTNVSTDFSSWNYSSSYSIDADWCNYAYRENSTQLSFNFPIQTGFAKVFLNGSYIEGTITIGDTTTDATTLSQAFSSVEANQEAEINLIVEKIFMDEEAVAKANTSLTITPDVNTTLVRSNSNSENLIVGSSNSKLYIGEETAPTNSSTITIDGNIDYVKSNNIQSGSLIYAQGDDLIIGSNVTLQNNINNTTGYGGAVYVYNINKNYDPVENTAETIDINSTITNCEATYGGGVCVIGSTVDINAESILNCYAENGGGVAILDNGSVEQVDMQELVGTYIKYGGKTVSSIASGETVTGTTNITSDLSDNSATYGGGVYGAITSSSVTINIIGSEIYGNTATYAGGGIYLYGPYTYSTNVRLNIYSASRVHDNAVTSGDGGGMYVYHFYMQLYGNSKIYNNNASGNGGGLFIDQGGHYYIGTSSSRSYDYAVHGNTDGSNNTSFNIYVMQASSTPTRLYLYDSVGTRYSAINTGIYFNRTAGNWYCTCYYNNMSGTDRTGYSGVKGYTTSSSDTALIEWSSSTPYQAFNGLASGSPTVYYPQWNRDTYTITYNANGGEFDNGSAIMSKTRMYQDTLGGKNLYASGDTTDRTSGLTLSGNRFTLSTSSANTNNFFNFAMPYIDNDYFRPSSTYTLILQVSSYTAGASGTSVVLSSPGDVDYETDITTNKVEIPVTGVKVYSKTFTTKSSFLDCNLLFRSYVYVPTRTAVSLSFRIYVLYGDVDPDETSITTSTATASYGTTYGKLPTPTRDGYTFDGWYTSTSSSGTQVTAKTTYTRTSNQTLYAHWTKSSVTVTFNANGGSVVGTRSKEVTIGSTYGDLPTFLRSGYNFAGWYTSATGGTRVYSTTKVVNNSDHTLYARWYRPIPTANTLTYNGESQIGVNSGTGYSRSGTYTATNAGTYRCTVSLSSPSNSYWSDGTRGNKTITWTIDPYSIDLENTSYTWTGSSTYVNNYMISGIGSVRLTYRPYSSNVGTYSYTSASSTSSGQYRITLSSSNFEIGSAGTFTISKRSVTIPTAISGLVYNGESQRGVSTGSYYILSGTTTATNARTYTAYAKLSNTTNCQWSNGTTSRRTITWTISKYGLNAGAYSVTYSGSTSFSRYLTGVNSERVLLNYTPYSSNTGSYTYSSSSSISSGEYYITLSDDNYEIDSAGTFTIGKLSVAVPTAITGLVYNGEEQTGVSYNLTYYRIVMGTTSETDAGDYSVSFYMDNTNYEWSNGTTSQQISVYWSIAPYALTVGARSATWNGGNSFDITMSGVNDETVHLTINTYSSDVGSYTYSSTLSSGRYTISLTDDNYSIGSAGTFTITKGIVDIPTAIVGLVYNGEEQTGVEEGSYYTLTNNTATDADDYIATATLIDPTNSQWSDGTTVNKTISWSIDAYGLVAGSHSEIWSGSNSFERTISGVNNETINLTYYAYSGDVGNYTYTTSSSLSEGQYRISLTDSNYVIDSAGTFAIERASIDIPTAVDNLVYNGNVQTGVIGGDYFELTNNTGTNAGDYIATATIDDNHIWSDGTTEDKEIAWSIARAEINIPTANTGLIYDGREKMGVNEGDYYTLSGHKQTNAGDYTAVASVDNNHIWSNGSTDDQLIDWSIAKAQVSVPTAVEGLVYNGEEQTGVIGGDYFELTNNTGTNAGNYTAIATLDDKNNFEWADGTTEDKQIAWSISKADGSFTFNGSTITYDATNHTLTATNVVGGTIEYSTEENGTYSSVPPTFKNVGSHTIYARLVGDDNHNDVSSKSATLVINPYELTIDAYTTAWTGASSYNRVVNGVGGESVTLTYTPSNTNAGTFTYQSGSNSFTLSLNSNNYEVGTAGNLILESVEIEFTVNGYTGVYDGDPHGITINVKTPSTGSTITYSETLSGSYSETPITRTDAGETTVYFKINATNYTEATGSAKIVISRAPIDAPTARTDLVYNGTLQTGVEANDEYYTITGNTGTNANQYTATLTLKSNYMWSNNSTDTLQISWSIAKYGLNVGDYEVDWVSSASSYTRTVDGVNNEDVTLSYIPHSNSVGEYTYSTTAGADLYLINIENTNNYEITSAGTFTISPIGIVYNAEGYTGTYDEEGHSITVTVTTPASGCTIYYSENESSGYTQANISKTDAGTYTIYFKIEADNYETATGSATIQINRKEIAIPKANTGLVYDGTLKVGLSEGTGYTRSGDYQETNAGTYTAIAVLDKNYIWENAKTENKEIEWTIERASIDIPTENKGLVYTGKSQVGVDPHPNSYYTIEGNTGINADDYVAIVSLDNNHKWSDGNVEDKKIRWSIAKEGLTVTADDKSMNYGDNAPSYTYSASGFVNNETNSVLSGSAVYTIKDDTSTISNVSTVDAGTYTIEISGLTSNNYEISFEDGTLTINKRNISACDIKLSQYSYNFDATEHKPTVSLSIDGKAVDESNYEVTYSDNVYPGTATVTVTATEDSNLTGSDTVNFTIIEVSYNIIYETNGGNEIANDTYTIKTNDQTIMTLKTPTRSGYSFAGYTIVTNSQNRDSTISGKNLTTLTIPAKAYGNITVEAHWEVEITIEVVGNKTGNTFEIIGGSNTITTSGRHSVPEGSELTFNTTLIADDSSSSYQLFSIYIDDELVRTVSSKNNENDHYQLSSYYAINKACTVKLEFKDANELTVITEEEYAIDTEVVIDGISDGNVYATDADINVSITLDTSSIATGPNAYIGFTYVMNGETQSSYNGGDDNIKQDLDGTSGDVYAYTFTGDKGITEIHVLVREVVNVNINTTNQSVTALSLTSVDNFTRQIAINESDNYQLYVGEWKIKITTSGNADKGAVIKNIFGEGKYRYDTETKTYYYIVESQQSST